MSAEYAQTIRVKWYPRECWNCVSTVVRDRFCGIVDENVSCDSSLTFPPCHSNYQYCPKHELTDSNDPKPDSDWFVSQCNSIYPGVAFSKIDSEPNNTNGSRPECHRHLYKEGANNEHERGIPRSLFAPIFVET